MSGRYPDLVGYDDDFRIRAFQILCSAPTSVDDAICMQNAYTALRKAVVLDAVSVREARTPWAPTPSFEPIGAASTLAVVDFQQCILTLGEFAGWELVDNFMADQKKCGALYCEVAIRNARIARLYMTTLKSEGKLR